MDNEQIASDFNNNFFVIAPIEERRDEELIYHLMTIKELQDLAPFIDWRDHFEDAFRVVKRKITEKEKIVVFAPEYLEKLTRLLFEYNSTVEGKM